MNKKGLNIQENGYIVKVQDASDNYEGGGIITVRIRIVLTLLHISDNDFKTIKNNCN